MDPSRLSQLLDLAHQGFHLFLSLAAFFLHLPPPV